MNLYTSFSNFPSLFFLPPLPFLECCSLPLSTILVRFLLLSPLDLPPLIILLLLLLMLLLLLLPPRLMPYSGCTSPAPLLPQCTTTLLNGIQSSMTPNLNRQSTPTLSLSLDLTHHSPHLPHPIPSPPLHFIFKLTRLFLESIFNGHVTVREPLKKKKKESGTSDAAAQASCEAAAGRAGPRAARGLLQRVSGPGA
eukprot:750701-Hanusia_phi.AAC.1